MALILLVSVFYTSRLDSQADAAQERDTARFAALTVELADVVQAIELDRSERRDLLCEREVHQQENDRVMWLRIFELFNESEPEIVSELRINLDELIPTLVCTEDSIVVRADNGFPVTSE